jgi:hypothetical protein
MITSWADEEDKANTKYDMNQSHPWQEQTEHERQQQQQWEPRQSQEQLLGSQSQAQARQHCRG